MRLRYTTHPEERSQGSFGRGRNARRTVSASTITLIALLTLGGCAAAEPEPQPLTAAQSESVAIMRYTNFTAPVRTVNFSVAQSAKTYTVAGWIDFEHHLGYANIEESGSRQAVVWTPQGIALHATPEKAAGSAVLPPLPPADTADEHAWNSTPLTPQQNRLHAMLALLFEMGNDRPDNAQLLAQTDARVIRKDAIDGTDVLVISAPSSDNVVTDASAKPAETPIRYWVDQTGLLHRMEVRLGGGNEWITVNFGAARDVSFAQAFTG